MQTATITATAARFAAAPQHHTDPDAELAALWARYTAVWRSILETDDGEVDALMPALDVLTATIAATPARTMAGVLVRLRVHLCDLDGGCELPRSYVLGAPADEDAIDLDGEASWRALEVLRDLENLAEEHDR